MLVEDQLDTLFPVGKRLLADPGASERVSEWIVPDRDTRVLLAVGPEGDWTDYEKELLHQHDFRTVSLGSRTLRTDTACIAMLALVSEAFRRPLLPLQEKAEGHPNTTEINLLRVGIAFGKGIRIS